MTIDERITLDVTAAMKAGRKHEVVTLRMLRAQIKYAKIDKQKDFSEVDVERVLQKALKMRKESIKMYNEGNREDLVAKESLEVELITKYLPQQLSAEEIDRIIQETLNSLNITSEKELGRIMGSLMPKVTGRADGKLVQQKVRDALSKLA
jgi:uncharacterized protein YqeY